MRRTVRRLAGCLGSLPSRQRKVLVLRAGVGERDPISRSHVGRRLELRSGRVARIERRGLRRLRAVGRDGCGDSTAATVVGAGSVAGGRPPISTAAPSADVPAEASTQGVAAEPRSGVKAEYDSSKDADTPSAAGFPPLSKGDGTDRSIILLMLAAFLVGYALQREFASRDARPG